MALTDNLKHPVQSLLATQDVVKNNVMVDLVPDSPKHRLLTDMFKVMNSSLNIIETQLNNYMAYIQIKRNELASMFVQQIDIKSAIKEIFEPLVVQAQSSRIEF
jgi:hypothetical protein